MRRLKEGVIIVPRGPRSPNPVSPLAPIAPRISPTSREPRPGRGPIRSRRIYGVDVGSTRLQAKTKKNNFAWTRVDPDADKPILEGNDSIESLCRCLVSDLAASRSVALGFEAPLFIPVPESAEDLSKGRCNEGSQAWSAPPGLSVTTLGLHQAAWILRKVARASITALRFSLEPKDWPPNEDSDESVLLFCWEAFVSGDAHAEKRDPGGHLRDAATATMKFLRYEQSRECWPDAVTAERPFSLIGAAAVWSGLAKDGDLIRRSSVVVRPTERFAGEIKTVE